MSSLRRRRASVFSTSYRPPRTTSHFPLERGDEVRFPQYEYQSSTGFTAPRRSEVDIDQISYESRHRRQNDEQSFSDDDDEQVIMAVDIKERGTVGCCYYVAQEEKLYILCDVQSGGKEIIELLKLEVKPTMVLSSTRADELTLSLQERDSTADGQFHLPYHIDVRPAQEFSSNGARTKLAALETSQPDLYSTRFLVPGDGLTQYEQVVAEDFGLSFKKGNILRLAGLIDIENTVSLGCAGAIITHLQRRTTNEYASTSVGTGYEIRSMETFTFKGTMYINPNTLSSLQILQSESHPNAFNQGPGQTSSRGKESFSLYGLFYQHVLTPQGKNRLRQYFLRPSTDVDIIRERQDLIDILLRPVNAPALQKLCSSMKKVKNIHPIMTNLHKGLSNGKGAFGGPKGTVWDTILTFAFHAIEIRETLREMGWQGATDFRDRALKTLDASRLHRVGRLIYETVDIDDSQEQQRTSIKSGVDRQLDLLKDRYNGLDSLLKQVAIDIATTIPEELDIDVNVIYFPQIGFNIAIPFAPIGRAAYTGGEESWEQMFTTENRAYFKDCRMREMDEKLGDMYGMICEREIEIAHELAQKVLMNEKMLSAASELCGELDCHLAMAKTASIYRFTRPRIVLENVIEIKGGRHPLQELAVASYVPNDVSLLGGHDTSTIPPYGRNTSTAVTQIPSMLLLTGPNYSGKSIYLKQVALVVYLAHIGSFVPAESAEIGIIDKILTRISTPETVSKIQSTFMIDLQQISLALNLATHRSLIIIDEFGKGTDMNDGAGLACGLFEHLLNLGSKRPKVLAATHFHELFEHGFLRPRPQMALAHMEVRVDEGLSGIGEQVTYLYNLLPGRSDQSFGTFCAAMNGIDSVIIARANELSALSSRGANLVTACATLSKVEEKILEETELIARRFLEMNLARQSASHNIRNDLKALLSHIILPAD